MTELSRPTSTTSGASPKVVVVRQPVKSVGGDETAARAGVRLGFIALAAAGAVALVWLLGYLGFRLGFASAMMTPELLAEPGEGLASGVMIVMSAPGNLFSVGADDWHWLMGWFLALAIPGGALAAVRSYPRGGPKPSRAAAAFNTIGAAGALFAASLGLLWVLGGESRATSGSMPLVFEDIAVWAESIAAESGLDTLALLAMILWLILCCRLSVAPWLRALSVTGISIATVVLAVGWAVSGVTAAQVWSDRSVCYLDGSDDTEPSLLLGYTRAHVVYIRSDGRACYVIMREPGNNVAVIHRQSLADWARAQSERSKDSSF